MLEQSSSMSKMKDKDRDKDISNIEKYVIPNLCELKAASSYNYYMQIIVMMREQGWDEVTKYTGEILEESNVPHSIVHAIKRYEPRAFDSEKLLKKIQLESESGQILPILEKKYEVGKLKSILNNKVEKTYNMFENGGVFSPINRRFLRTSFHTVPKEILFRFPPFRSIT